MFKELASVVVTCLVAVYPVITQTVRGVDIGVPLVNRDDKQFSQVRNMFKDLVSDWTVPSSQVTWNPVRITNNPRLTQLCALNPSGNYQNPFDCTQFIMCAGSDVWLWTCPGGCHYDPIPDMCVYPPGPYSADDCPWSSIWTYPDIRCATIGQRLFWSPLTFPVNPEGSCRLGDGIYFCNNHTQVGSVTKCPPGTGYCKAYLACIKISDCLQLDHKFGLLK